MLVNGLPLRAPFKIQPFFCFNLGLSCKIAVDYEYEYDTSTAPVPLRVKIMVCKNVRVVYNKVGGAVAGRKEGS